MFNYDQFNTFADSVDKMVPTDRCSQTELQFILPGNNLAKAEYVRDYTSDGRNGGTVIIYWDYDGTDFANKTEVDSLQYAIDAVEGLIRMHGGNTDKPAENPYENATIDDIASDIVTYMYDNYPGASYIGDKEGRDGSIMLRFDWGKEDQATIQNELSKRYGDRIKFTDGQLKYAPEIKLNFIRVLPIKSLAEAVKYTKTPVMEAEMTTEEIINKPDDVIEIDPTAMTSNSDPLVEYLKGLESFNGWDPTDIQMWARDNHDAIQEYYNQCKNLDQAIQMCLDDEKDKFYQDFNKYESVRGTNQKVFCESVTKLCETAGHPEIGEAVVKLMEAIEAAECTGDCVQLDEEPNFDVTIAVDTLDPNPAHYRVAGYDAMDALEKVANDLKTKGHVGYFEDNPTYEEDYYEVAGTFIPSWLVNIEKIA